MATHQARRRLAAIVGGLAVLGLSLGFVGSPANAAPPPSADYVALGDSYTAGTGAGGLYRDAQCWQSSTGYVDVVADMGRVNLLSNLACHGALLVPGGPFYNGAPTVIEQIASGHSALHDAELVSITAGAIDAGSLLALRDCATPDTVTCAGIVNAIIANLPALEAGLEGTYQAIQASAPQATIAVLGYPRLFDPVNGAPVIPVQNQAKVNQAIDALNSTIAKAVADSRTNAKFIDVTKRFAGHAANSLDPWIVLDFRQPLPDANFHPNVAGHQAYASALISSVKPAQLAKR